MGQQLVIMSPAMIALLAKAGHIVQDVRPLILEDMEFGDLADKIASVVSDDRYATETQQNLVKVEAYGTAFATGEWGEITGYAPATKIYTIAQPTVADIRMLVAMS